MRKKWVATVLSATALSFLAAGCGDDDDVTVPDTGMVADAAVDSRVADATIDAQIMIDAALPSHSGTVLLSELHAYTGLSTFISTVSASVSWQSVTGIPSMAVKTGNPGADPIGQCIGLSFVATGVPSTSVLPDTNTGNAGTVTFTGHRAQGDGCTAGAGETCAPATITCTRGGTGAPTMPFTYNCDTPVVAGGTDNRPAPVNNLFDATAPRTVNILTTGGTDFGVIGAPGQAVSAPAEADMNLATRTAIATTQVWNGTAGFTATLPTGANPVVNILRIEMSNGDPTQAGTTGTATCNLGDTSFPSIGKCNANRYAVLTCVKSVSSTPPGDTNFNTATAAQIASTFADILPTATVVRVTNIGVGLPSRRNNTPGTSGRPNPTLLGAGQGSVFFDTTPRTP